MARRRDCCQAYRAGERPNNVSNSFRQGIAIAHPDGPMDPQTNLPEWELPKDCEHGRQEKHQYRQAISKATRYSALERLDRIMPPRRRYLGLSRGMFLLAINLLLVVIIVLAVALPLALRKHSIQDLPLPSDSQTFRGDLTYYAPGLGACGITSSDSDDIVSISHFVFDAESMGPNPNANILCTRKIRATRFDEQTNARHSVDLEVVDRCTGCAPTDIDVSPGVFKKLADPALGRVTVTWAWLSQAQ